MFLRRSRDFSDLYLPSLSDTFTPSPLGSGIGGGPWPSLCLPEAVAVCGSDKAGLSLRLRILSSCRPDPAAQPGWKSWALYWLCPSWGIVGHRAVCPLRVELEWGAEATGSASPATASFPVGWGSWTLPDPSELQDRLDRGQSCASPQEGWGAGHVHQLLPLLGSPPDPVLQEGPSPVLRAAHSPSHAGASLRFRICHEAVLC